MASGWPGKGHGALLKNSIRARLWVHSAALEAPNRSFGDRIESHKRTLGSFSTGSCLLTQGSKIDLDGGHRQSAGARWVVMDSSAHPLDSLRAF